MTDERLQILKMLEEGKITVEEASQLLEALISAESVNRADAPPKSAAMARWVRIEVEDNDGDRVHIKLPLIIVRAALRLGGHFNIAGFGSDQLGPEMMSEIEQALMEGERGVLIDAVGDEGEHVKIYLE